MNLILGRGGGEALNSVIKTSRSNQLVLNDGPREKGARQEVIGFGNPSPVYSVRLSPSIGLDSTQYSITFYGRNPKPTSRINRFHAKKGPCGRSIQREKRNRMPSQSQASKQAKESKQRSRNREMSWKPTETNMTKQLKKEKKTEETAFPLNKLNKKERSKEYS